MIQIMIMIMILILIIIMKMMMIMVMIMILIIIMTEPPNGKNPHGSEVERIHNIAKHNGQH